MKSDLSHLAHHVVTVDKYRPQTCCIVGTEIEGLFYFFPFVLLCFFVRKLLQFKRRPRKGRAVLQTSPIA